MPAAPRLHELQQGIADALLGRGDAVAAWVVGAGLDPAARLRVYRNAVAGTLTAALRDSYPTVLALVGEDFFEAMAARYRLQHPSRCGNLQQFGGALAGFLQDMPEAQRLDYLPDVARLDWLRQLAALAADALPVDAARSAMAAMAAADALRVRLHPSVQLLRSRFAVLSLWQWCRAPSAAAAPRVDGTGEQVLLWRDGGEVAMASLDPATFRCVERLGAGDDVASAWTAAVETDPDFDLEPCLRDLLAQGLIVAFIPQESDA
ncbi:MAG: DNA-binding domain-containing protein [Rhodanobacter sp.]|jgi:hypothetical protein|nr:DNA-binding domain-containing protein [Rhodanobacter sp.]